MSDVGETSFAKINFERQTQRFIGVSGLGSSTWDLSAVGDHHKKIFFL
ncbi:MAG: hypothetical protein CM1200mP4_2220 [Rhodospirillaceae bacterium]|nr:MAG: hypothetical protein CM1200mP4_2220 [Rhodospirillaceae bacterium]